MNLSEMRKMMRKGGLDNFANIGAVQEKLQRKIQKEHFENEVLPKLESLKKTLLANKAMLEAIMVKLDGKKERSSTSDEKSFEEKDNLPPQVEIYTE